jgi:hypothetical protein
VTSDLLTAFSSAQAAVRDRGSVEELFALYEVGMITLHEVMQEIWKHYYDKPARLAELSAAIRRRPGDSGPRVADMLDHFSRQE